MSVNELKHHLFNGGYTMTTLVVTIARREIAIFVERL